MGRLPATVFLEILQNDSRVFGREIGSDAHVQQNGLPLGRGSLGWVAFRVTAIAMHGVKLGTGKLMFWLFRNGGRGFG